MEAKMQHNFYNKAAIGVTFSLEHIHFQKLVQKVTKWLTIIHYFLFMLHIAFTLSNNTLAHFHHWKIIDGLGLIRLFFWYTERCFRASGVVYVVQ